MYLTGSSSHERNRRESSIDSITLDDVRREIQVQLNSVTASQLCSPQDKICLQGPPGAKGDAGLKGRRGRRGTFSRVVSYSFLLYMFSIQSFSSLPFSLPPSLPPSILHSFLHSFLPSFLPSSVACLFNLLRCLLSSLLSVCPYKENGIS